MEVTKCKHCCQPITLVEGVWIDGGLIIKSICMSNSGLLHEPEEEEKEAKDGS